MCPDLDQLYLACQTAVIPPSVFNVGTASRRRLFIDLNDQQFVCVPNEVVTSKLNGEIRPRAVQVSLH
jgi:hypothetical protein